MGGGSRNRPHPLLQKIMRWRETEVFSLWLMPEGDRRVRLADTIHALARRYNTPEFEPHVTLLGSVERSYDAIGGCLRTLVRQIHPMSIRLESIESRDQYFRCLYLRVENSRELQDARLKACALFDRDEPYQPHLSLMYGAIGADAKQALARDIGAGLSGTRFTVRRVSLYRTHGVVEDWRPTGSYALDDFIAAGP
jgi:2'-5' RNA ligase